MDGAREGQGEIVMPDGFRYSGDWKSGEIDGKGTATYGNGDVYEGSFSVGLRQGEGLMRYTSGQILDGNWDKGVYIAKEAQLSGPKSTIIEPANPALSSR